MKKLNNNSGFTLIEIIVVLIIIGILAAIALPNLFSNVSASQAGGALQTATALENPIEACVGRYNTVTPGTAGNCGFMDGDLDITTATTAAQANAANDWTIYMAGAAGETALNTLTYDLQGDIAGKLGFTVERASTGVFTCTPGVTPYNNVC